MWESWPKILGTHVDSLSGHVCFSNIYLTLVIVSNDFDGNRSWSSKYCNDIQGAPYHFIKNCEQIILSMFCQFIKRPQKKCWKVQTSNLAEIHPSPIWGHSWSLTIRLSKSCKLVSIKKKKVAAGKWAAPAPRPAPAPLTEEGLEVDLRLMPLKPSLPLRVCSLPYSCSIILNPREQRRIQNPPPIPHK